MSISKAALFPDKALVEIAKKDDSGSGIEATTQISSMSISGFGRDTDSDPYFGDAKVKILKPQEDGEISFDVSITNEQWDEIFWGGTGSDFTSGSDQQSWRLSFLVTNGSATETVTPSTADSGSAAGAIGSTIAYRTAYADCSATAFEPTLEADSYLQGTITFKVTPVDESAIGNVRVQTLNTRESADAIQAMAALGSYTTTAKW